MKVDELKTWGEMNPEEKGALLLAKHEGKTIQWLDPKDPHDEWDYAFNLWADHMCYRVKPEPEVKQVILKGRCYPAGHTWFFDEHPVGATHKITFNLVDGKPDCLSIQMEEL